MLWGYFQRLEQSIRGVSSLTQVSLFPLAFAGTRTILEILVDLVLLSSGDPIDAPDRIEAWELSAKLKAARAELAYRERVDDVALRASKPKEDFVRRESEKIHALRLRFWPNANPPDTGRHPDRWTGRNLLEDCKKADSHAPFELERFYETTYRHMNWNIHGSGFAGVRGLDVHTIEVLCAQAHLYGGRFAVWCARLVSSGLRLKDEQLGGKLKEAERKWCELALRSVL